MMLQRLSSSSALAYFVPRRLKPKIQTTQYLLGDASCPSMMLPTRTYSSTPSSCQTPTPSSTQTPQSSSTYHIEVSNLAKRDITQLIVTGKGVPGLLASLCVTVTLKGGDIKELHAADCLKEEGRNQQRHHTRDDSDALDDAVIRDVIYVVDRQTGHAFDDSELHGLGQSLLEATQSPMDIVKTVQTELDKQKDARRRTTQTDGTTLRETNDTEGGSVTVIPKGKFPAL